MLNVIVAVFLDLAFWDLLAASVETAMKIHAVPWAVCFINKGRLVVFWLSN